MTKPQVVNILKVPDIWEQLSEESLKITKIIDSGVEPTKSNIKEVRRIKKEIDNYVKSYKKSVKDKLVIYDEYVAKELEKAGYTTLETVLNNISAKNKQLQTERETSKMAKVNELIKKYKEQYFKDRTLKINTDCLAHILTLFPDLSSGAKNKEIKDWTIIENIIKNLYKEASEKLDLIDDEALNILSYSSDLYSKLINYFRTGDFELLEGIEKLSKDDENYIKTYKLEEVLVDPDIVIEHISKVLTETKDDSTIKITKIEKLLELHRNGEMH